MREKIDELIWAVLSFGRECSDEWWANQKTSGKPFLDHRRKYLYQIISEEIEKGLLTDEEILGNYYDKASPLAYEATFAGLKAVAQTQLKKILALLKEK